MKPFDAEQNLLAAILYDCSEDAQKAAELSLKAEDFTDSTNRDIFNAILTARREGEQVDAAAIAARLDDAHTKRIADMASRLYSTASVKDYIKTIRAGKADRDSMADFTEVINAIKAGSDYIELAEEKLARAKGRLAEALSENSYYVKNRLDLYMMEFDDEINHRHEPMQTGFDRLDEILGGGITDGLYVLGAISSLGKTSFALQLADQLAERGNDILFFSLEMSKAELISKSLSRLSFIMAKDPRNARTTFQILNPDRTFRSDETDALNLQIRERYIKTGEHLYITEGIGSIGTQQIADAIRLHIAVTGRVPVVMIDYLQILTSPDVRMTDKQATDRNIFELKRISRKYRCPIIGISSFNRDSYTEPLSMTAFKESGAIEYSSDVLIGLQYDGMDYEEGETQAARTKRIRTLINDNIEAGRKGKSQSIQVKILKYRNGSKDSFLLDFYPMFNYFARGEEDPFKHLRS